MLGKATLCLHVLLILGFIFLTHLIHTQPAKACVHLPAPLLENGIGRGKKLYLNPQERLVTILGTNDIHGGIEPRRNSETKEWAGGMAFWGGAVEAIRKGLDQKYGGRAGVVVTDAGDQFQGTLLSNYNEGQLLFALFDKIGYDAMTPGNHGYDFGPKGWLDDRVNPKNPDKNPRGALERLVKQVKFPLIGANTYLKKSLKDKNGNVFIPEKPEEEVKVDWKKAKRPGFIKIGKIVKTAGLRVALIGLENVDTPDMTTRENVSDLYFRSVYESYMEARASAAGKADIFVIVYHHGNSSRSKSVTKLVEKITQGGNRWNSIAKKVGFSKKYWRGGRTLDAVVAGHTHQVHNDVVNGVPIIQSGAGGLRFGRVDLVWSDETRGVVPSKTRSFAGATLFYNSCDEAIKSFCSAANAGSTSIKPSVRLEGVRVVLPKKLVSMIRKERKRINGFAKRKLGKAEGEVKRARIVESPLVNAITDGMRSLGKFHVAFVNGSGVRADLKPGPVTYEDLFNVLPFNNHAVRVGPMTAERVMALLLRSVKTCGGYSGLFPSGWRVEFNRDCKEKEKEDEKAFLVTVRSESGKLIFDKDQGGLLIPPGTPIEVVTLDFLADGGSGYKEFQEFKVSGNLGILRESLTKKYLKNPFVFTDQIDGRFKNLVPNVEKRRKGRRIRAI